MSLVNYTVPGLFGGVSQQAPSLRHDTQVSEMVNCYPTIVGGVLKRPPTSLAYVDNSFPEDAYVYTYDRGSGNEKYIIAIRNHSPQTPIISTNKFYKGLLPLTSTYDDYVNMEAQLPYYTLRTLFRTITRKLNYDTNISEDGIYTLTNNANTPYDETSTSVVSFVTNYKQTFTVSLSYNTTPGSYLRVFINGIEYGQLTEKGTLNVPVEALDEVLIAYGVNSIPSSPLISVYSTITFAQDPLLFSVTGQYRIFDIIKNKWVNDWTPNDYLNIPVGASAKDCFTISTVGDTSFVVNKTVSPSMEFNTDDGAVNIYTFGHNYVLSAASLTYWAYSNKRYYAINGTLTCTISTDIDGVTTSYSKSVPIQQGGFTTTSRFTLSSDVFETTIRSVLADFEYIDTNDNTNSIIVYNNTLQTQKTLTNTTMQITFSGDGSLSGGPLLSSTGEDLDWENTFYYWVKRTNGDATDNSSLRYTYYIYDGASSTPISTVVGHDSTTIAQELSTGIGGETAGSVVRKSITNGNTYSGADSWGNQASEAWQGKIKRLQDLPTSLGFEGAVIQVTGDENTSFDDFYVKYEDGVYKETVRPGLSNTFRLTTMPHKLEIRRLEDNTYYHSFSTIEWGGRKVGDYESASDPSFIGQPIQDVFFYRNRLGFISGDNVILSEAGEYYNFYPTTITSVLDSDPIDVAVDSNKALTLKYALPYNKELLIFGDKAQFTMGASDTLTPTNVSVQQSTAFEITDASPVVLGPNAYFVTEKDNYSTVREYYTQSDSVSNDAANITSHCPNYIPKGIVKLVGSSKTDMLFALSKESPNVIYVYNFYWSGEEKAQSAWHRWEFDGSIFNIEVIGSTLLVMINRYGQVALETLQLEANFDFISLNYQDTGTIPYKSSIFLTQPGFKTGNVNVDDIRGTFVLRSLKLDADYGSLYNVVSYRVNKPKDTFYNSSVGIYPARDYIASKEYNIKTILGAVPSTSLYPSTALLPTTTTYAMPTDNKYTIMGNVNNLEIEIENNIAAGFKLNSLDILGTYTKYSRNV